MDMTPLIIDADKKPLEFIQEFIQRFGQDVTERIGRTS
jgi:hypothetical protein